MYNNYSVTCFASSNKGVNQMKKATKTSEFGVSKRESHDSSDFYSRSMYNNLFTTPATEQEVKKIEVPKVGSWADRVYLQSSTNMTDIPDNSVALAFTSPPYNVGKAYDDNLSLQEYLDLIKSVGKEVYRVLRPGGRYVINIANLGRKPYIPLHALFYQIHWDIDFLSMGEIIWRKAKGASGSCAWGSWMSPKSPRLRDLHEYLLVFAKQSFSRPDKGQADITKDEFMASTLSIWEVPAESAKRVGHPAPFPVELAARVIRLYSFVDDIILDPFNGSGTTCVAAVENHRHYIGFDISEKYVQLAETRITAAAKKISQLRLISNSHHNVLNGHTNGV
jgi:site-specific DNA-methyltransferase (adenine-specific)